VEYEIICRKRAGYAVTYRVEAMVGQTSGFIEEGSHNRSCCGVDCPGAAIVVEGSHRGHMTHNIKTAGRRCSRTPMLYCREDALMLRQYIPVRKSGDLPTWMCVRLESRVLIGGDGILDDVTELIRAIKSCYT
jgi:hypothetical protein